MRGAVSRVTRRAAVVAPLAVLVALVGAAPSRAHAQTGSAPTTTEVTAATTAPASVQPTPVRPTSVPPATATTAPTTVPTTTARATSVPAPTTTAARTTSTRVPARRTTASARTTTTTTTEPPRPAPAYVADPQGNRQKAAAYAYTWADRTNPAYALFYRGRISVPVDNPSQRGRAIDTSNELEVDCTAYMSQALHEGGFAYTKEWRYDPVRHTSTIAWVRASGPGGLPATFVRLGRMRMLDPRGSGGNGTPPPGIELGDIVVWDLDGAKKLHVDHELMVTEITGEGASWGDIRVSYHTYDHRNRALDEYLTYVLPDAPHARLYVYKVAYPS